MKTMMKTIALFAVCVGFGCSKPEPKSSPTAPVTAPSGPAKVATKAPGPTKASAQPEAPTIPAPDPIKIGAPVELTLKSTGHAGEVRATLAFKMTADVPEVVARFVLPPGVTAAESVLERRFGAMVTGASASHTVTLQVPPSGRYKLGAGVDCVMNAGMTLSVGEVLFLGDQKPPVDQSQIVRPPNSPTGLRLSPAKETPRQ